MYAAQVSTTKTLPTQRPDPSSTTKPGVVVGVLAGTGIVISLAQTLVVPILGELPVIFDTDPTNTSWIITITLLVGAVANPVLGRLADMYAKKPVLLIAITPFIAGSVVCALATDVVVMIIGRGLQGLAAGMIPLGISLLHDVLPKERVGSAIALMSSSMGIGGALGLPIAAAVAQFANWRVLFWITAVAGTLAALAIWRIIPGRADRGTAARFDYVGALGLAAGLVPLLLAISKGADWGWTNPWTIGCLGGAGLTLLVWGRYELRRRAPLIDLRTTASPVVLMTNLASVLIGFAMYAMNLIIPQVMQLPVEVGYGFGQSMLQMGLWMAPMGLGMMAVSKLGAAVSRRRGPKVTLTIAGLVIAVGYGAVALVLGTVANHAPGQDPGSSATLGAMVLLAVFMLLVGCGVGFAYGAMPALIMGAVPSDEKAAANSFNALTRSLGLTVSAAVIGAVLAATTQQSGDVAIPGLSGFVISLLIGCAAALVAAVIAALIPDRTARRTSHG